jgi:L-ascorbate metabolism protein UlaG (beta-lactamase superfamily)
MRTGPGFGIVGWVRLTKLGHSCVRLEKDGAALVIDPGGWSDPAGALAGASAVLITHEHPDHLDADAVRAAMTGDPALELWANASVTGQFGDFGSRVHAVDHGDTFTAAGFGVHVYGHDHAQIYREIPIVRNTGFAVDGEVFHPGDSLTVPEDPVPTLLLLPIVAPWLKTSEMIDYAREVAPQRAYAIHDAILNANGLGLMQRMMQVAAQPSGAPFSRLEPGTTVDL